MALISAVYKLVRTEKDLAVSSCLLGEGGGAIFKSGSGSSSIFSSLSTIRESVSVVGGYTSL